VIEERLMDAVASLVAHLQPTVAVHPRQSSFHDPPVSPLTSTLLRVLLRREGGTSTLPSEAFRSNIPAVFASMQA
jgi:hypothetical protein